jgi:hypothetical protein
MTMMTMMTMMTSGMRVNALLFRSGESRRARRYRCGPRTGQLVVEFKQMVPIGSERFRGVSFYRRVPNVRSVPLGGRLLTTLVDWRISAEDMNIGGIEAEIDARLITYAEREPISLRVWETGGSELVWNGGRVKCESAADDPFLVCAVARPTLPNHVPCIARADGSKRNRTAARRANS